MRIGVLARICSITTSVVVSLCPGSPVSTGCVDLVGSLLGAASDVKVTGTTACILNGNLGVEIVDYADPLAPVPLATIGVSQARNSLDVEGDLLVHCGYGPQIAVVDLQDSGYPQKLTNFDLDGGLNCRDIVLRGGVGYAVDYLGVFYAVGLADPSLPIELGRVEIGDSILYTVDVEGDLACVVGRDPAGAGGDGWRLHTIDIADPADPHVLGSVDIPQRFTTWDIQIHGDTVLVPTFDSGLVFIDIADPADPRITGSFGDAAYDVLVENDLAYVTTPGVSIDMQGGLEILDLSNPGAPVVRGGTPLQTLGRGLAVKGDTVLIADGQAGLTVVDAGDPQQPTPIAFSIQTPEISSFIVVDDTLIEGRGVLRLFDVGGPAAPAYFDAVEIAPNGVAYIERVGATGFGCSARFDEPNDLAVFDLTDPETPAPVAAAPLQTVANGYPTALAVGPTLACVTTRDVVNRSGLLEIFDITTPAAPVSAALITFPVGSSSPEVFEVIGDLVSLRDTVGRLVVLDASTAGSPVEVGAFTDIASIGDVTVAGGVAWIVDRGQARIAAVDMSSPGTPIELGEIVPDAMGNIVRLSVSDGLLYVTDLEHGLGVYDIRVPRFPFMVGSFDPGPGAWLTRPTPGRAYTSRQSAGLYVLDTAGCGCTPDLAEPFGTLDLADIVAFITAFMDQHPLADLAEPFGVFDLADLVGYVTAFGAGCP